MFRPRLSSFQPGTFCMAKGRVDDGDVTIQPPKPAFKLMHGWLNFLMFSAEKKLC